VFPFLYLKIVRQHGGVARKASDTAVGVLQCDDVKPSAASRNLSGNLNLTNGRHFVIDSFNEWERRLG
jgi:hypothetical protein